MRLHERLRARRSVSLLALLFAVSLVAAACGGDDDDTATSDSTTTTEGSAATREPAAGGDVEGEIFITGSSTVEPISVAVADSFEAVEPGVTIDVEGPGTGDGFALFCAGDADITGASRAIKADDGCEEAGFEFVELKVASDGLTVMTNPANAPVECLTTEDLYALTGPESEGFGNWKDAQALATELGSTTVFPDAPLDVFGPGEESGTYDAYIELALAAVAETRVAAGKITEEQAGTTRPDYQSSPEDNTILRGVEDSDSSFGWVGFAFAQNAGEGVKELQVDAGDGCVAPTAETITDNSYPLSRPLYIYVSKSALTDKPEVQAFVDYYLSDEGLASVAAVGYVDLPADEIDVSRTTLADGTTGSEAAS